MAKTIRLRAVIGMSLVCLLAAGCLQRDEAPSDPYKPHAVPAEPLLGGLKAPPTGDSLCGMRMSSTPKTVRASGCEMSGDTMHVTAHIRDIGDLSMHPGLTDWPARVELTLFIWELEWLEVESGSDSMATSDDLCNVNRVAGDIEVSRGLNRRADPVDRPDRVRVDIEIDGSELQPGRPLKVSWVDVYRY